MEANYRLATTRAYEFLLSDEFYILEDYVMHDNISNFPLNLKDYAKQQYNLVSYTSLANELNIPYCELKKILKNSWGTVVRKNYSYTIAYDDKLDSKAQLFTIAHEIGHIEMGHLAKTAYEKSIIKITDGEITSPNTESYKIIDYEADCFARNLLCPVRILNQINYTFTPKELSNLFGITESAAKTRLAFYKNDLYYSNDVDEKHLIARFYHFLSDIEHKLKCKMSDTYIQYKESR